MLRLSSDLLLPPPLIGPLLEPGRDDWMGVNMEGAGTVTDLIALVDAVAVLVEVEVTTIFLLIVLTLITVAVRSALVIVRV